MRYELSDEEWAAIKPMLPNKPRGPRHALMFDGTDVPVGHERVPYFQVIEDRLDPAAPRRESNRAVHGRAHAVPISWFVTELHPVSSPDVTTAQPST
jgi:transposase